MSTTHRIRWVEPAPASCIGESTDVGALRGLFGAADVGRAAPDEPPPRQPASAAVVRPKVSVLTPGHRRAGDARASAGERSTGLWVGPGQSQRWPRRLPVSGSTLRGGRP
jgi:hypothetical protein